MKSLYKVLKNTLLVSIILIFNQILGQKKQEGPKTSTANPSKTEIKTDTIKLKQESLTDIVKSKADNIRNDIPKEITYLNKQAQVIYGDMQIDADYISIDRKASKVFARGKTDSLGKIISPAKALQGGKSYEYDSFVYNLKTKQAVAYNTRTQEGEGMIAAEKTKKVNDSVFFMRNSKYTTDEYFIKRKDTLADYYMLANNIKLVKKKESSQLITGPIQMYISDVPTPFALPFAVLPMSTKRAAGLLMPSFGERQDAGFFMQNLGYYQPLGDHFDLKIMSDFFTRGSWNFKPELNYFKNYSYRGSFRTEIGKT